MPGERPLSTLILAEIYESGDLVFVDRLIEQGRNLKPFIGLIEKWKKDKSSYARRMKLAAIVDMRLDRLPFKRLFKQAWHDKDHELMGAFLVRLDRSIRRQRRKQYRYVNRTLETSEVLRVPAYGSVDRIFSTNTTHYLRRRAWRYFRRLGRANRAEYLAAIAGALVRYTDDDVRLGQNLLDNWGLMHACFGKSDVLSFNARHTNLKADSRLAEMAAAPMFERAWAEPAAAGLLLTILLDAACRPVRVWAIQLLRRHHAGALAAIDAALLLRLIDHADPDVGAFAAEVLGTAAMAGTLPVTTWLQLLATRNATVVASIVESFRKNVNFDRVTLPQAVELATRPATPVARLGLEILRDRPARNDADLEALGQLANARCAAMGEEIGTFAMQRLNVPRVYRMPMIVAFFDSPVETIRMGAFDAVEDASPAAADPAFWSALLETPYDDVRASLVRRLNVLQSLPGAGSDSLARLWQGVLLNINRGGRAKLSALMQISRQITQDPESAEILLPVIAVAIRSVRPPEARHGLAAVVSAVERSPALADAVARYLPELQLDVAGASR